MELLANTPTVAAPAPNTTGTAFINVYARGEGESRVRFATVRFAPCARTAWHSHSIGQILQVTEGVGIVATRDDVLVVRPGDTVYAPPGEVHWHGALPDQFMAHLSIVEGDATTWADPVTDEEYEAAAAGASTG